MKTIQHFAEFNSDLAYVIGFAIIVAIAHVFFPYKIGLNCATDKGLPFRDIDVWSQVRKPRRIAIGSLAILIFGTVHYLLGMPLVALIAGMSMVALMAASDYIQIYRAHPPSKGAIRESMKGE